MSIDNKSIVIIDSSYYNFLRFTATKSWYEYNPDREQDIPWLDNKIFMKTFEKMWFEQIKKICKFFNVLQSDLIFARDGQNVWRYNIFPNYKISRSGKAPDNGPGPVFKHVNENYHAKLNSHVIRVESAEADDIIAVACQYIKILFPTRKIIVISGDYDLLQITNVEVFHLKGGIKKITSIDPHLSKMIKILAGDPSDGIPQAFPKIGKETAKKIANDPEFLKDLIKKFGRKQYDLNVKLIDFDQIPNDIVCDIEKILDSIFY
jgi:5'-3' exonuclease